jgi:TatD DNase family protein
MSMLFDTHAHLIDSRFDADRQDLLQELPSRGIGHIVTVACKRDELDATLQCAQEYDYIYAAFGIHPHYTGDMTDDHLALIEKTCAHEKVVALGEIGLDYHYTFSEKEVQKKRFIQQLELAGQLKMPAILHIREAFGDAMDILRNNERPEKGVLHCYSGSYEFARECIDMGFYVSFAGVITFENSRRVKEVAQRVPKERTVIETDCPYLAPHPMRGRRNDPGFVIYTAQKLAELWEMDLYDVIDLTSNNAKELFGI